MVKRLAVALCAVLFILCCEQGFCDSGQRNPASPADAGFLQKITASGLNLPPEMEIKLGDSVSVKFVLIPAGEFHMGSPDSEKKSQPDERPLHWVKISEPFYIGKYEVTQAQYNIIMRTQKNCKFKGDSFPVENVNWLEVNSFINNLSTKCGLKFRLPTEVEWEYACRAGTNTPFYTGETISDRQANYDCRSAYGKGIKGIYIGMTTAVGSYPPNAFGLYDMYGNVWEWCSDRYDNAYYRHGDMIDPKGPSGGKRHVIRGGSWKDDPALLRSAERKAKMSGADKKYLGFRVVLELPNPNTTKLSFNGQLLIGGDAIVQENPVPQLEKAEPLNNSSKTFVPVEHELVYNEKTQKGYISVKGMGLEARLWMVTKIGEICSSKNIVIQQGEKPELACFKLLDEKLKDGKFTIEFECK